MSSALVDALTAFPWCVLSMLSKATHVKTMSLTTFSFCYVVPSKTLNLPANTFPTTLLPLGDPVVLLVLLSLP